MLGRLICDAVWTFWFGGLTFYIAVVVPLGSRVIGSDVQGEITAEVTFYLNLLAMLAAACVAIEARSPDRNRFPKTTWSLAATIAAITVGLIVLRAVMLTRMPGAVMPVSDTLAEQRWSFYSLHRVDLWLTTLHWIWGVAISGLRVTR